MKTLFQKLKKVLCYTPGEGTRLEWAIHWPINLAYIGLWCVGSGIVGLYFAKVGYGPELFWSYIDSLTILGLNLIPGCMIALLLLFITGRVWPAILASGLLNLGVAIINHYKLLLRDDPLLFSDISNIAEAAQISGNYTFTISPALVLTVVAFIIALVLAVLLMKARIKKALPRIIGAVLIVAACAGLYVGLYASPEMYERTNNLAVEFSNGHRFNMWNDSDKYRCRGYMYPFIHSATKLVNQKPEGYDRKEAEAILSVPAADIAEDEKVNIISIMLEAYCDLSKYDSVAIGDTDPYDFFHRLQEESYHGSLLTNIFAGGTIDTERCFVTGSMNMYEYRSPADSFVRYFTSQGYRADFCHAGYDWFYNRRNVMEYLGFEQGYFRENRYTTEEITGDELLFPDILSLYGESKAAGEPYFNFTVTYQNHGPYLTDKLTDPTQEFARRGELSESGYCILNNYLEGISRTDRELEKMVDSLRADPEPVVLILFGDHKPWLGDNSFVYSELGINLSYSDAQSFYNYFETPYIIWANDAAKAALGNDFVGKGDDISPCFLMMKLFDLAGWEGDAYMNALRAAFERTHVASSTGIYFLDGEATSYIEGEPLEKLDTVRALQYYRMHDYK